MSGRNRPHVSESPSHSFSATIPLSFVCTVPSSLSVQSLRVGQNSLGSIPPEIGSLTSLKELDASRNHLTKLPAQLCNLTQLTVSVAGDGWGAVNAVLWMFS